MINSQTGKVTVGNIVLYPHIRYNDFISSIDKREIYSSEMGEKKNLYLLPQQSEAEFFTVRLLFDSANTLQYLYIAVNDSSEIPTYQSWSEQKEIERKERNDIWLIRELGPPPYTYPWGKIVSVYNAREASSYVIVDYKD